MQDLQNICREIYQQGRLQEYQSSLLTEWKTFTDKKIATLNIDNQERIEKIQREFSFLGPVEQFLNDDEITEILINGTDKIWIEKQGILLETEEYFILQENLERFVRSILQNCGRKIDRLRPFAEARLQDGSRFSVVMDPAAVGGYHVAIRKFSKKHRSLKDLEENSFLSKKASTLIEGFIKDRKNILISGATGSGKTSLLNSLSGLISQKERIITLEDTLELQLQHRHVVRMETRPANTEGEGEISLQQLLRSSLRLRPDRIILGECRGAEVCELLQALNTGHQGSMATIHANSSRDALLRLELLLLLNSQGMNIKAAKTYIASAIQVVFHVEKINGLRRLQNISEVMGVEDDVFILRRHEV